MEYLAFWLCLSLGIIVFKQSFLLLIDFACYLEIRKDLKKIKKCK